MVRASDPKNPTNEPPAGGYGGATPAIFGPDRPVSPAPTGRLGRFMGVAVPLGLALGVVGSLASLAIYGLRTRIEHAKQAEVRNALGMMAKSAAAAYERDTMVTDPVAEEPAGSARVERRLCASASKPVPADATLVSGKRYAAATSDWEIDKPRNAGFACLRFAVNEPQYYQYRYTATETTFVGGGRGDLDGDRRFSDFQLAGEVRDSRVVIDLQILETDPEE